MKFALPAEGTAVEKNRLDCKAKYRDDNKSLRRAEMAKDVAAFANANGGHLLVGSVEKGGVLAKHVGLDVADAAATRRDIEEAVRDLVRPAPVIEFPDQPMTADNKVLLVVAVQPFPGQAVGVHDGKADEDAWRFPVRVGTQTVWFSPEQLVLLMDVRLRRNTQLLSAALGATVQIRSAGSAEVLEAELVAVEAEVNAATFRFLAAAGKTAALPIDAIDSVWRNGKQWLVQVRLGLHITDLAVDIVVQHELAYGTASLPQLPSRLR